MDYLSLIRKQLGNLSTQDDIQTYCTKTYSKINNFRIRKQLCDVILKVDNCEFYAHKIVLAAASDYFSAMFSCGMSESEQSVIELKSISINIITEVLDYIYTGNAKINNDNVQELLPAANLTQLFGLKRRCCVFLMGQLDPQNVLGIRRFSELHDCPVLEKFSRKYAAHNLEAVISGSDEFVLLTASELKSIIRMPDLNVYSEESVYKSILKWVYHSADNRIKSLPSLLKKVRLSHLSIRFLTDIVSSEPLIRSSIECRDLLDDAKLYHLRPDIRATLMKKQQANNHSSNRDNCISSTSNHFLVLVGGFGAEQAPINSVEMFDPRASKWTSLPSLPGRYRYVAACSISSCIYVIGGFDGRERLNTVSVLDLTNQSRGWMELAPMHFKRGLAAACAHNGQIFVCGGFDGVARLKSLEVYDRRENVWRRRTNMDTSREGAGLVVVDSQLYCIGGYNGMQLLDTVEKYDIAGDRWQGSVSMHYRRSGAGCAVMHEVIYVCGGYGGASRQGPQHLDSVECFNTLTEQWSFISSMQAPRCYIGACQMDGLIWVAAGYDGNRLLNTVEVYDKYGILINQSSIAKKSKSTNTVGQADPSLSPTIQSNNAHNGTGWNTLKSYPMRYERCDTGMCIVRLFQLAESPSNHNQSQTVTNSPSNQPSPSFISTNLNQLSPPTSSSSLTLTYSGPSQYPPTQSSIINSDSINSGTQQRHTLVSSNSNMLDSLPTPVQHNLSQNMPPSQLLVSSNSQSNVSINHTNAPFNSQSGQPLPSEVQPMVGNRRNLRSNLRSNYQNWMFIDNGSDVDHIGTTGSASLLDTSSTNTVITATSSWTSEFGGYAPMRLDTNSFHSHHHQPQQLEEVEGRGGPQQLTTMLSNPNNGVNNIGSSNNSPFLHHHHRQTSPISTGIDLPGSVQAADSNQSFFPIPTSSITDHQTSSHNSSSNTNNNSLFPLFYDELLLPINANSSSPNPPSSAPSSTNPVINRPLSLSSTLLQQHNTHQLHQRIVNTRENNNVYFQEYHGNHADEADEAGRIDTANISNINNDPLLFLQHFLGATDDQFRYPGSSASLSSIDEEVSNMEQISLNAANGSINNADNSEVPPDDIGTPSNHHDETEDVLHEAIENRETDDVFDGEEAIVHPLNNSS